MNGKANFKKLKIFIASPGDVKPERDRVHALATELNRTVPISSASLSMFSTGVRSRQTWDGLSK